jgi:hypothetical protein
MMMMKEGGEEDVEGMVADLVVLGGRVVREDLHTIRMMTIVMIIIIIIIIMVILIKEIVK